MRGYPPLKLLDQGQAPGPGLSKELGDMRLMLDTNIFNRFCDGRIGLNSFDGFELIVTHVQFDELSKTPDLPRRASLLEILKILEPTRIATESAVWDISNWDECGWGTTESHFEAMLKMLQDLDSKSKNKIQNQQRDILIAETSILGACVLVSDDRNLQIVTRKFGGQCFSSGELNSLKAD